MVRGLILICFTFLIMHLHTSGEISKYINMKYSYLSLSAGIALAILSIVQIIIILKEEQNHHDCEHGHCGHHHSKENKWYKKLIVYPIFAFPIISGLFFPVATLDSNIVKAKGFHFPIYNEGNGDPYAQQQFLRPDTSVYFGKEAYRELINKDKENLISKNSIVLTDTNYLEVMETIYNFPGEFDGKEIEFTGFVFHDEESADKNQLFVFRFGVIHCIADSGVFGMMVDIPNGTKFSNDEWIKVKGKLSTIYYQPFKTTIPYVKVEDWSKTNAPKEQYVYRGYQ